MKMAYRTGFARKAGNKAAACAMLVLFSTSAAVADDAAQPQTGQQPPTGASAVQPPPGTPAVGPAAATTPSGTSVPPSAPPTSPLSTAEAQQQQQAGAYNVKLRDLERKVDELKEQVFRSKARLNLLKETVLHGVIAGARSAIVFKNEMSGLYVPVKYSFALDGTEIFNKSDESGKLGDQKEFEIYNGSITPGNHTITVQLTYQGNSYGVFAYLKGYKFIARSSHTFTASEGKQLQLKVVGYEKGNAVTTDPKDRPAVDFRENFAGEDAGKPGKPADGKPAPANK